MKILDSIMKNITPAQNAAAMPKNTDGAEKIAAETPDAATESGRIIADLKAQGYEISSDEADRISEFIDKSDGTESEKLQTVKTALDKNLPLTERSLQSIRAALFHSALPKELAMVLADSGSEVSDKRVELIRAFAELAALEESGTKVSDGETGVSVKSLTETAVTGQLTEKTNSTGDENPVVAWLLKALEKVAALSEALGTAEDDPEETEPRQMDRPAKDVHRELRAANISHRIFSEPRAEMEDYSTEETRPEPDAPVIPEEKKGDGVSLKEAVDQLISSIEEQESDPLQKGSDSVPAEALIQGVSLLMKEITPRIAAVKTEFEALRKSITADLKAVGAELEKPSLENKAQVVERLSQTIEKLDKAILKSDIPLYTSMKAEKQLLKWSSELQEARTLVSDGKTPEAAEIVARISKGVEEIRFQPANLKVIHRAVQQAVSGNEFNEKGIQQRAQQQINRILEPIHTPREVLEAFKAMGLTHESEVISALGQGSRKLKEDWQPQENLKEILMKLASDTQEKLTTVTGAEKALNNLTGQQLLSRPEAKPQGQTLFFSVPMEVANRVEDLKIYVQSRKDKGKVDWENCTFYFAVHTEKFGDVGIRFAAARKSVSIQVKCDNQALRDAVAPMVEDFKQTMWETGYKIAGISYSPLKENKAAVAKEEAIAEEDMEGKGLNLKV